MSECVSVLTSRNRCNAFSCAVPVVLNLSKYGSLVTLQKFRGLPRSCISGSVSTEITYKPKSTVLSERLEMDSQFIADGADGNKEPVVIVK